jgi:hypothetical protein
LALLDAEKYFDKLLLPALAACGRAAGVPQEILCSLELYARLRRVLWVRGAPTR